MTQKNFEKKCLENQILDCQTMISILIQKAVAQESDSLWNQIDNLEERKQDLIEKRNALD